MRDRERERRKKREKEEERDQNAEDIGGQRARLIEQKIMIAEFRKFEREISLKRESNGVADEVNADWESTNKRQ